MVTAELSPPRRDRRRWLPTPQIWSLNLAALEDELDWLENHGWLNQYAAGLCLGPTARDLLHIPTAKTVA